MAYHSHSLTSGRDHRSSLLPVHDNELDQFCIKKANCQHSQCYQTYGSLLQEICVTKIRNFLNKKL